MMTIRVQFWSYFKDLASSVEISVTLPNGATVADLLRDVYARFPKLAAAEKSTLIAVGVDYQPRTHQLKEGDEVSLFPPVQGG
jgi:molybdopterin converting factor small subunit